MRLELLTIVFVLSVNYAYAVLRSEPSYDEPTAEQARMMDAGELAYEYRSGRFVLVPATPVSPDLEEVAGLAAAQ